MTATKEKKPDGVLTQVKREDVWKETVAADEKKRQNGHNGDATSRKKKRKIRKRNL